ncbi:MAG TPA: hypothetical protein VIL52_00175 [Bacteroidota bacterium]
MARPTVTLKYNHPTSGATERTLAVNAVRTIDDPDEFELFPGIQHQYLNGALEEQIKGFRRVITIDFGVLQNIFDRFAVLYFLLDPERTIDYSPGILGESDIAVALENPGGFANEWMGGMSLGKRYVLRLREKNIRQIFPTSIMEGEPEI